MSFEIQAADNCGIGAAVFAAGGAPLPAYVVGLDLANCLKTLDIPAQAIAFGRITGSLEAQVDVLAFGYDEIKNHQYIGTGHTIGAAAANALVVGVGNTANAPRGSILGGSGNTITTPDGFLGAGVSNQVLALADAAIVAGTLNINSGIAGLIGAGTGNSIATNAPNSFIGGGQSNTISSTTGIGLSAIVGGFSNQITRHRGFIGGGQLNQVHGGSATISGGSANIINIGATSSGFEFIGGGSGNVITNAAVAVIGGGINNAINGNTSVIGGGRINIVNDIASGIFSGEDNQTIAGTTNAAINGNSFIGGGSRHRITGVENSIVGGDDNAINTGFQGVIGGGQSNRILSTAGSQTLDANTIAGGQGNVIDLTVGAVPSGYASIGGGLDNQVTAEIATIPGGQGLRAQGYNQIVKGYFNVAQGASPVFVPNDQLEILGNGTAVLRRNAYAWQHDATLVWFANTQVPLAASNAAAIAALTAAKPVATHAGAMTMVVVAGINSWFVCDSVVWKFAF